MNNTFLQELKAIRVLEKEVQHMYHGGNLDKLHNTAMKTGEIESFLLLFLIQDNKDLSLKILK
jgi:hypothetical protein